MNKFYIQTALFLISIFTYANNEILATEPAPGEDTTPQLRSRYPTPEEVYEKNKHLLRALKDRASVAELMKEATEQIEYHATSTDGYEPCIQNHGDGISYYKKKHDDKTDILKINLNIYASSQYNDIVNRLWDPNSPNIFNKGDVKIVRVYSPNLIGICQSYKKKSKYDQKYFTALVSKAEISKDKTIIAMTSSNTSDGSHPDIIYKNPILKNAYLISDRINPKYYSTIEKYKKIHVNLAGYLIEKKGDDLEITYIESIDGHSSI
ncbi:fam-a protein [Plasmodium vinckei petteri]|uniref:Fam-a protein n=1 Tax=Plasmodium vinckei petteri TaxID=138298 RepID=A0A6V7T878_PLAVN|nr:fam-a protein [Plasmodium vinckei petteri]